MAGVVLATGCTSTQPEADLVVYSGRSESLVGPIVADFEEATGKQVEVRYGSTSGMAAQVIEEGDRSPADVFWAQDAGALGAVAAEGLFTPIASEVAERVPQQYRGADDEWAAITGRARVLVVNPEVVPVDEVPTSVFDLTEPQYAGEVAIAPGNASFQSFVTAMRVANGDAVTEQWLTDLQANDVELYDNNVAILEAVEAGEAGIGLINHYYWFRKAEEVGQDQMASEVVFTAPGDPGTLVNVAGAGMLAGATNPEAAQEFVDYLLSEDVQTRFAEDVFEYPVIAGVPAAEGLPALEDVTGPDISLAQLSDLQGTVQLLTNAGLL